MDKCCWLYIILSVPIIKESATIVNVESFFVMSTQMFNTLKSYM